LAILKQKVDTLNLYPDKVAFEAKLEESLKTTIKVKGLAEKQSSTISFIEFENLLVEGYHLQLTQKKWIKSLRDGDVSVAEIAYDLKISSMKRKIVYENVPGKDISLASYTVPYNYDEIIVKDNSSTSKSNEK